MGFSPSQRRLPSHGSTGHTMMVVVVVLWLAAMPGGSVVLLPKVRRSWPMALAVARPGKRQGSLVGGMC